MVSDTLLEEFELSRKLLIDAKRAQDHFLLLAKEDPFTHSYIDAYVQMFEIFCMMREGLVDVKSRIQQEHEAAS